MSFSLRNLLEGKPIGHPLHPLLVHFPIALFLLSFGFDIAVLCGAGNSFVHASFYLLILGLIGALLAAVPGFADYTDIRADHPARPTATVHMLFNLAAVVLFLISFFLRCGRLDRLPLLAFIGSALGVGLILYSGFLGGRLVYDNGIAVGRHRRLSPTPTQTLTSSTPPAGDAFIPIAPESALPEGQTLRAEIEGTVIALVRLEGKIYAFQEFCPHRFGPLSEGCFHDHQVTCPWHESSFDVRSGAVTHGPAKVPLKTYETTLRAGQIHVKLA
jgi:nitrite reductase/ring-hydroxylating ferredoxin subunit/uncharacterized membrane protein